MAKRRSKSAPGPIEKAYRMARDRYAQLGVDTDKALRRLATKPLSLPCWLGDDVTGFDRCRDRVSGGIQPTGSWPGRARNIDELRQDLVTALALIPGRHRVNLHAMYGEFGAARVDRNNLEARHFEGWVEWARSLRIGLDFNATLFSHPLAESGFTLSSLDKRIRSFWIEHVKAARRIASSIGRALGTYAIHNLWMPDGMKDACVERLHRRSVLEDSLDRIYRVRYRSRDIKDALEGKLFGLGSEGFVVGSNEFHLGYAITRRLMPCLDLGHYHPTESVADKISSTLVFCREILLHLSRGVRWDSDHVVTFDDAVREVALEIVRSDAWNRVHIALDYFDASINRIAAWIIGAHATLKALLFALLEPAARLRECEQAGDYGRRLMLLELSKTMPFGAVWDYHCLNHDLPPDRSWFAVVQDYERHVLSRRGC